MFGRFRHYRLTSLITVLSIIFTSGVSMVLADDVRQVTEPETIDPIRLICPLTAQDVDNYQFEFMADTVAVNAEPGQAYEVEIQLMNTGATDWCGPQTRSSMGDTSKDYQVKLATSSQPTSHMTMDTPGVVYRGEVATYTISGVAPTASGIYREYYYPEVSGLEAFRDQQVKVDVRVNPSAQDYAKLPFLRIGGATNQFALNDPLQIVVDLDRVPGRDVPMMYVYKGGAMVNEFVISPGAWRTPTPRGDYTVYNKQDLRIGNKYPHYRMPQWVGLRHADGSFRGFGLHALPYIGEKKEESYFWREAVNHLGTYVSHGCVRMDDDNAVWLWNEIDIDTTKIKVTRNWDPVAQTERI